MRPEDFETVLLVGSDGRTHALYEHVKKHPCVKKVYVAPGNGGIPAEDRLAMEPFNRFKDHHQWINVLRLAHRNQIVRAKDDPLFGKDLPRIDLVIPCPEQPLVDGVVDLFQGSPKVAFGPTQAAARLEGSKVFCKLICTKYGIPTAPYAIVGDVESAYSALAGFGVPIVIKADGLCAGKGVKVADTVAEAKEAIHRTLVKKVFGDEGNILVLERKLEGKECSVIAICDGERAVVLPSARDYKRALDRDRGDNTGGMGAYSPIQEFAQSDLRLLVEIKSTIILPLLKAMKAEGAPYRGVLYAGIMLTENGPKLFEVNCRLGDPETQTTLPLLTRNFFDLMKQALAPGGFPDAWVNQLVWSKEACVCVTLVSQGYPDAFQTGFPITGIEKALEISGISVFHAGTEWNNNVLVTNGGRVLNVVATAATVHEARERAYSAAGMIQFENKFFRTDIAA